MPYSSGTYSAPSSPGAFNPAISGQQATPTAWNALLVDLSAALSTCLLKDGTQTVTANIPMANHKITGLANGTASTDAANLGQVATGALSSANDTGAANAYVIAPTVGIVAYAAYQSFSFKAANANTTTSTLAVSGLAAKTIKHLDGTDLLTGDILAGELVQVMYDGTNFQLLSATGLRGTANTWRAASTFAATATMSAVALNEAKGANIASAATTDIGAALGNYVHVTGTTTITALGTVQAGTRRVVVFDGILTLTHNATSLILPTGANITTAAGDSATFESEGSGNWKCVDYQRTDGTALATTALGTLVNVLGGDVALNNTASFFDGPSVAQGTTGTWLATGSITISGTFINEPINVKLWDGTTVIASTQNHSVGAGSAGGTTTLSGVLTNPAADIRISAQATLSTTGSIMANLSGAGKDSLVTVVRLA